jgi:hypothetical protein
MALLPAAILIFGNFVIKQHSWNTGHWEKAA